MSGEVGRNVHNSIIVAMLDFNHKYKYKILTIKKQHYSDSTLHSHPQVRPQFAKLWSANGDSWDHRN